MIRILVVDDHKIMLHSFEMMSIENPDIEIVATCTDASKALEICKKQAIDVILMDVCTENGSSGIDATKEIKSAFPNIKIIVMTGFNEVFYLPESKSAGADAFMYKSSQVSEFAETVRAVMVGKGTFPEASKIPTADGKKDFTKQELEILRLLCQSYSRDEIVDQLFISKGTLKRHIENMLTKADCHSVLELIVYVTTNGWIGNKPCGLK